LNSPDYDIEAVAFDHGEKKIEWINRAEAGNEKKEDRLQEKRESFRIYIGIPVDCQIEGEDSFVLLVDVSEKGFRIVRRESTALKELLQSFMLKTKNLTLCFTGLSSGASGLMMARSCMAVSC